MPISYLVLKREIKIKIACDRIQEMKSKLKDKELKTFSNAYQIKLILNERSKINK